MLRSISICYQKKVFKRNQVYCRNGASLRFKHDFEKHQIFCQTWCAAGLQICKKHMPTLICFCQTKMPAGVGWAAMTRIFDKNTTNYSKVHQHTDVAFWNDFDICELYTFHSVDISVGCVDSVASWISPWAVIEIGRLPVRDRAQGQASAAGRASSWPLESFGRSS